MNSSTRSLLPDGRRAMTLKLLRLGGLALLGLTASTCSREQPLVSPGNPMRQQIACELAVFYPGKPLRNPSSVLDALLKEPEFSGFRRVKEPELPKSGMTVASRWVTDAQKSYSPPDAEGLRYVGRGLDAATAATLPGASSALVLDFGYRRENLWRAQKSALQLLSRLAHATGGVIWDDDTREVFSPETWDETRLQTWTEEIPALFQHFTIHIYRDGEYLRAISLGMAKFGLPDIVVQETAHGWANPMTNLINLLSQSLAEGGTVGSGGRIDVEIQKVRNPETRAALSEDLKSGSTGRARLVLRQGKTEEGDPDNQLVEISFEEYQGPDVHARQAALIESLFGADRDETVSYDHDETVQEASRHARTKLPALRATFGRGLAPGESILLKAPFKTPDGGHEWMWVEVTSWRGDDIRGLLDNQPNLVPGLHQGQVVKISEREVFDYLHRRPDGSEEGNETGAVLQRRSKSSR